MGGETLFRKSYVGIYTTIEYAKKEYIFTIKPFIYATLKPRYGKLKSELLLVFFFSMIVWAIKQNFLLWDFIESKI